MNTDQTAPFRIHIVCNVDHGILDKREQRTNVELLHLLQASTWADILV